MGIISVNKADHLYWLGRYVERVYTTLRWFFEGYDRMLDENEEYYKEICQWLSIPDVYGSAEVFSKKYPFDLEDENSIISNLLRAYDNAMVMRDEITSETLSYIHLALDDMKQAESNSAPLFALQNVLDHILAFWGMIEEMVEDEQSTHMMKTGKEMERMDLYLRFRYGRESLFKEFWKLNDTIRSSGMNYNKSAKDLVFQMISQEKVDYCKAVALLENVF